MSPHFRQMLPFYTSWSFMLSTGIKMRHSHKMGKNSLPSSVFGKLHWFFKKYLVEGNFEINIKKITNQQNFKKNFWVKINCHALPFSLLTNNENCNAENDHFIYVIKPFQANVHFLYPWKHKKPVFSIFFSGVIEKELWLEMGLTKL